MSIQLLLAFSIAFQLGPGHRLFQPQNTPKHPAGHSGPLSCKLSLTKIDKTEEELIFINTYELPVCNIRLSPFSCRPNKPSFCSRQSLSLFAR